MSISSKFLGASKGNSNLKPCLSDGGMGGSGESHSGSPSSKFIGTTKGNTDLKINRTSGVDSHDGGAFKAGGPN